MSLRQNIVSGTRTRLKAFKHVANKSVVRFSRLSKPLQLVTFAVIFAAMGGTYLFIVNFASDTYGNIHTTADEVVIAYEPAEHGYTLIENDIPEGENISGVLVYGNGLMLCGSEFAPNPAEGVSNPIYSRNLTRNEIREMFAYLRDNGFDDLYKNPDPKSTEQPVEASTSIVLNTSKGSRRVVKPVSTPGEQFDVLRQYLADECAKAAAVYDTDEVIVETITLDADGSKLPELPADLIDYDKSVHTKKGTTEVGEKGKKIKEKLPLGTHQFKTEDGKTLKVRTSQQIPSYQPFVSVNWRGNEDSKGKVSAQSSRSVRFLYVVASDQAIPGNAQAYISDVAATLPGYYQGQVGKSFVTSGTAVVRGSLTAGQYQACPAGENCFGRPSLASYYNLRNEFRVDGVNTVIFYGWLVSDGCMGWGGPVGNLDSADFSHGVTASPAANCDWTDARHGQAAHEAGHGFGLVHTCDATMMRDSDPARNCPPKATGYGAPLNQVQRDFLRDRSPYFAGGTTTPPPTTTNSCQASNAIGTASKRDLTGYWFVDGAGVVYNCGSGGHFGDMRGRALAKPIVGMAATPSGNGYWLVASDGGIFAFGDAAFKGSMGGTALNSPIVGMAAHPSNGGYWMVAADGGIFAFGTSFFGSMGGRPLNKPIVGMASSATGNGYWMFAGDGGIFAFGDSTFHGSTGNITLAQPIVAMAPHPQGGGYWMVARDGGVFAFGSSVFYGSAVNEPNKTAIIGVIVAPDGKGYTVMTASGQRFPYGSAVGGDVSTPDLTPPPLPDFATSMNYTSAWPKHRSPTGVTGSWTSAWPQRRDPTGVQMNWYTAWDGGALPGYCAQIFESNEPWEETWNDNQLCSNIDLGMWYTSAWPADRGIPGNCVRILENAEPPERTWYDNVICTDRVDINLEFSENGNRADDDTTCVNMHEGAEWEYWADNYLCWNTYWPNPIYDPLPADCVFIRESNEPWEYTWDDNVLCLSNNVGLSYTSAWPAGQPIPGNCVALHEHAEPPQYTWHDNVVCTNNVDIGLRFSEYQNLTDANTTCVNLNEPSSPYYWGDNYLCWNTYWPGVTYDPLPENCVFLRESAEPWEYTWDDNVLCTDPHVGLTFHTAYPASQAISPNCVRITEPSDPHTWDDNVLCSNMYIDMKWSYTGSLDNDTTDCVNVFEYSDPAPWGDNYLCWYVPPPGPPDLIVTNLDWTPATPQTGNQTTFTATIKNQGTGATPNGVIHGISFWVDGAAVGWNAGSDASLAPGASRTLTGSAGGPNGNGTWTATSGSHTIMAFVDDVNRIPNESNESNNQLTANLSLAAPNTPPTAPTSLHSTGVTSSSVSLAWNASTDDKGVASYHVFRNGILIGTTSQLSYTASDLNASTSYNFQVTAVDTDGAKSAGSNILAVTTSAPTDTTAPTTPGNFNAVAESATKINLSWTASTDNVGVTKYNVYRAIGTGMASLIAQPTGTTYSDTTATASTTYTYSVRAVDAANNLSAAASKTVTTPAAADTTPPATPTNLTGSAVSPTQVNLAWSSSSDTGGSGLSGYEVWRNNAKIATIGLVTSYGDATATANATYSYYIKARDGAGNTSAASNIVQVTTLSDGTTTPPPPPSDTTAPDAPTGLQTTSVAYNKVDLAWTASTSTDTVKYHVLRNGIAISNTTGTTFSDTTVSSNTSYTYTVKALDAANNLSAASNQISVSVPTSPDRSAPVTPTGFTATATAYNNVDLRWSASTSGNVTKYYIYRDNTIIAQVQSPIVTYSDNTVSGSTTYSYSIRAVNSSGSVSPSTNVLTVTTPAPANTGTADTTPPSAPSSLSSNVVNATQVNLSWTAATDNVRVARYDIYRNGVKIGSSTTTSYGDGTVRPNTGYSYYVKAVDASNNVGPASNTVTIAATNKK